MNNNRINSNRYKINLSPRKIKITVQHLNEVLDEERIFGQAHAKEVIKELIVQSLTKDTSMQLFNELASMPFSEWQD